MGYEEIAATLRKCNTHDTLRHAWVMVQIPMKALPVHTRAWLAALKDHRKRMITDGSIDVYDEACRRADLVDWCDHDTRERIRTEAAASRSREDLHKLRGRP